MTKQEAKRYLHEKYQGKEIYPHVVEQFRQFEGDWEELIRKLEEEE